MSPLRCACIVATTMLWIACGEKRNATSMTPAPAAPTSDPTPSSVAPAHERASLCDAIGLTAVSPLPPASVEANRRALAAHERARFEDAERLFREVLETAPDYTAARFNLACARSRLGRLEEARRDLVEVLCADLPSYAPRAASDPDLEAVRATTSIAETIDEIATTYLALAERGTPLVIGEESTRNRERDDWAVWTQAGAWVHAEQRFVPMGPRARARTADGPWIPIAASRYDPDRRRTVTLTARGNEAEGLPPMRSIALNVHRAPTGELEFEASPALGETYGLTVYPYEEPVLVRGVRHPDRMPVLAVGSSGTTRWSGEPRGEQLSIGLISWAPSRERPGFEVRRNTLYTPDGEHALPPRSERTLYVDEASGVVLVIASRSGDCGLRDRYAIDRVDLRSGEVDLLDEGDGQVIVDVGLDGALYLQVGARVRRFATPRAQQSEALPRGVQLSTQPVDFNPHC